MPSPILKMHVPAGEIICREGEAGDHAFAIEAGHVEVLCGAGEAATVVATLGPGEMLGEMSMLDDKPRTATVRATEDCVLLVITREQLAGRLERADPVLRMCFDVILHRFRSTQERFVGAGGRGNGAAGPASLARPPAPARPCLRQVLDRIRLEQELRAAIGNGDLALHYQPVVRLADGGLVGFEALVRWQHDTLGTISPAAFVPLAEETGLIHELDAWVMQESCAALSRFNRLGAGTPLSLSINCGAQVLADPGFAEGFERICSAASVAASQIKLEVTETALVNDPEPVMRTLTDCQDVGARIALDDFGTGYSSLSYLHRFPIDTIKIDRSFVGAMLNDPLSGKIVRTIAGLADDLGVELIAEGIETRAQSLALADVGCDLAQGFHYARPMPFRAACALIASQSAIRAAAGGGLETIRAVPAAVPAGAVAVLEAAG